MKTKQYQKKKPGMIGVALMGILLLLTLVINFECYQFRTPITQFMSRFSNSGDGNERATMSRDEALEAAYDVTQKIEEEGIVLLENKGGVLPLNPETDRINLFGFCSYSPIYGGSGSGGANEDGNVTVKEGLEYAGFSVNEELWKFYENSYTERQKINIFSLTGNDHNIYEQEAGDYSKELLDNARAYSDTAVVVIGRGGGEGGDLPQDMSGYTGGDDGKHYLELQQLETDMLEMVKSNFDRVIVLVNSSNAMELGFLEDDGIDAALWIGGPGSRGLNAVGEVLAGSVNPSGKLADTYAYDLTTHPSFYSFGDFTYLDSTREVEAANKMVDMTYKFVDYLEGIYVGYRFYETRWIDNETGLCDEEAYQRAVQYPFGYGLSYTTFDKKITNFEDHDSSVRMEVEVTNKGTVAGKEVVEIYYTAPYYEGSIEKSHVVLAGFEKTGLLGPGESETVTISFDYDDMASYDYAEKHCYVLEHGEYEIKLMEDSHRVIDSRSTTVESDIIYNGENGLKRANDLTAASNQFDDVTYGEEENIVWVSRADWEGTLPSKRVEDRKPSQVIKDLLWSTYTGSAIDPANDPEAEPITTGEKNGLKLKDLAGLDFDDPKWDLLLNQMTVDEMNQMTGKAGWGIIQISSVGNPYCKEIDGPAGLNGLVDGVTSNQYTTEVVLASTWNTDAAYEMGSIYGEEALSHGISGLYAPGMDMHRSPFGGRNFEYYSEDGLLAGMMGASEIKGLRDKGIFVHCKHYALNDQETNREGICTWANEQAIREIYLKPYECAVKFGDANGVMCGLNRIGTSWTGAHYGLMTAVLRDEWGMVGTAITDGYSINANSDAFIRMNPDLARRAGCDLSLANVDVNAHTSEKSAYVTELTLNSNYGLQCLRESCHRALYMIANSAAMTANVNTTAYWPYLLGLLDVVVLGATAVFVVIRRKKARLWKEACASDESVKGK